MQLTTNSLIKALVSAALLTGLGAYATTAVDATQTQTAPKQDFVTLLARADLSKQGITHPTKAQLAAEVKSIQAQRASGMGWGEIANSLGLKLGEVVSDANRKGAENSRSGERGESGEAHASKGGGSNGGGSGGGHGGGKK